jgi:AsmA protein
MGRFAVDNTPDTTPESARDRLLRPLAVTACADPPIRRESDPMSLSQPVSPAEAPAPAASGVPVRRSWVPASRRNRVIAGVAVILALGAAIAPWSVSRDALREDITSQLRSSSGLFVFTRGRTSVALLPRPHVRLENIAFVDPNGALVIEGEMMRGDLRLLPLLAGRLEIAEISLEHPSITIDVDRRPLMTAGAAVRAAETPRSSPEAARADAARLGILTITDGAANLRRGGASIATIEHLNMRLDWRTVASPLTITGQAVWRGRRREGSLWIGLPAAFLRGEQSPLALQMKDDTTSFTTTGTAVVLPRVRFEGQVQMASSDVSALLRSIGIEAGLPAALSATSFNADVVASPTTTTLNNLKLHAGDDDFEGTLAFQTTSANPVLVGTLATRKLSLDHYLADLPSLTGADGRFSTEPFDLHHAAEVDLDLRLSAGQLRYGRLRADDAAMALLSKAGRYELSIADARTYKGMMKARAVVGPGDRDGDVAVQASLLLRGVDWGAVDWEMGGQQRVVGAADATLSVEGSGDTVQRIARDLHGQGRVFLTKGDITGLDLVGTLSRLDKRPLAAATDMALGHTPFDRASVVLDIKDGVGTVASGVVSGPGYTMDIAGTIPIAEGQLALKAAVKGATAGSAADAVTPGFLFEVTGPWSRPSFLPDVRGWIRRSDAASPLFGPAAVPAAPPAAPAVPQ